MDSYQIVCVFYKQKNGVFKIGPQQKTHKGNTPKL